jgi:hypothetical protein
MIARGQKKIIAEKKWWRFCERLRVLHGDHPAGGKKSGGSCIDGAVTVAPAGTNLAWGWVGSYDGKVYVAWSNLVRK